MKALLYQTSPILLDVQANLDEMIEKIHKGRENGARLIVFPELALTGYFVGDKYHEAALTTDSKEIKRLIAATRGAAAIVGFIEESPSLKFYNSALVAVNGQLLFTHRKLNLPNYGVFEERKYFAPGETVRVFRLCGFTVAVLICNDVWHPSLPYLAVSQKADILVTIFNSAEESMGAEFSNIESWEIIDTFYSRVFGIYNLAVNRAGDEVFGQETVELAEGVCSPEALAHYSADKVYRFWGGSEIINPFGRRTAKAAYHEPDSISAEISKDLLRKKRILLPYLRDDDPYFTHRTLQRILYEDARDALRDYLPFDSADE